ncbi:sensor domain-containing protein, partial [Mycobacterium sp. Lab-001]
MVRFARPLLITGVVMLAAACTRLVDGTALPGYGATRHPVHGVDVDTVLLDQPRMRAITGAGEHLTV